jgi:hypothetical protein
LDEPSAKREIPSVKSKLFQRLRNLRLSRGRGNVNCRLALLVSEISVGPGLQERSLTTSSRPSKEAIMRALYPRLFRTSGRAPYLKEQASDLRHAGFRGEYQRRISRHRGTVDVESVDDTQSRGIGIAVLEWPVQRCSTFRVGEALIGLIFQQRQYCARISVVGRNPQSAPPCIVHRIDGRSI